MSLIDDDVLGDHNRASDLTLLEDLIHQQAQKIEALEGAVKIRTSKAWKHKIHGDVEVSDVTELKELLQDTLINVEEKLNTRLHFMEEQVGDSQRHAVAFTKVGYLSSQVDKLWGEQENLSQEIKKNRDTCRCSGPVIHQLESEISGQIQHLETEVEELRSEEHGLVATCKSVENGLLLLSTEHKDLKKRTECDMERLNLAISEIQYAPKSPSGRPYRLCVSGLTSALENAVSTQESSLSPLHSPNSPGAA